MIAREAEQHNIDLRLCGEMAGDPMCVAILIGLGFRHLSMNGRSVARVKYLLRHIEQDEARELAARSRKHSWQPKCAIRWLRLWSDAAWAV